jgi:AraC-like DNA-binding protein
MMALTLNRPSAPLGVRNAVLWARSRQHAVKDFPGPLSIKSVSAGTVAWKTGGRELLVDRDSFLVLNHGEPYSMHIDSRRPVTTLCVFFEPGYVEAVCGSMAQLDLEPATASATFLPRLRMADSRILPRMRAIAAAPLADRLWIDQQFVALAADLAMLQATSARRVRLMPARRAATREELFRRVRRGQEFLHAAAGSDIDLAGMAREACLSPYHFHRSFTQAFGQTPHQYLTSLRMARARRLLETTRLTVTEVCGAVGFESAASFSALFRRTVGVPPSKLRRCDRSSRVRDIKVDGREATIRAATVRER